MRVAKSAVPAKWRFRLRTDMENKTLLSKILAALATAKDALLAKVMPLIDRILPAAWKTQDAEQDGQPSRGKLLHKLLYIFLPLSIVPILIARFLLIGVSDYFIQKESRDVKLAIAQKVAGNVSGYIDNIQNILLVA